MRWNAIIIVTLFAGIIAAHAQTNSISSTNQLGSDAKSAISNVPGQQFPKVDSERHAEFRLRAPKAQRVQLDIGGHKYDLAKDDQGMWSFVTPPLAGGFHYYAMIVDGVSLADPASDSYFGTGKMSSGIEVPSPGEDFYLPKQVSHGDIRAHSYFAKSTSLVRRCFVYTPPGYDTNPAARYPVLYLQHGMGEDATGWPTQGRAGFILDNLITEGKARPMLVVMDDGGITPGVMGGPRGGKGPMFWDKFTQVLIEDIIPMMDATYRTIPDREHRAMAGLSLGGTQTLGITQAHLDKFSCIGVFSAPFGFPEAPGGFNGLLGDPGKFAGQVNVLFISIGTAEGGMTAGGRNFHQALEKAGIKHVYYESPGTAHEWQTWRRSLHEFAPLLFQSP